MGRRERRLLEHHVRVRAPDPERAHPRAARDVAHARPVGQGRVDAERAGLEIDARVRAREVEARRERAVLERQHRLDEPGHPGRRVQMADIALHRAERAESAPIGGRAEGLGQRGDLDGIAELRAGAVRLDVGDAGGIDPGHRVGPGDDGRLPVHARRGVADLERPVVVDGGPADDRVDVIAVGERLPEALEHHHADALARHRPLRPLVERPAVPVGRQDHAGLVEVPADPRHVDRHAAREGHVALVGEESLAGHLHRHQRRGARGLDRDAGPAQVQLVRHPGGEEVLVVGQHRLVAAGGQHHLGIRHEAGDQIAVQARAGVDARVERHAARRVSRALERLPRRLQEHAVLRVHDLGFPWAQAEEHRVEQLGALEHAARPDVARVAQKPGVHPRGGELLVAEERDRLHPRAEIVPVLAQVRGPREPPGHPDDGDGLHRPRPAHRLSALAARGAGEMGRHRPDRRVLEHLDDRDLAGERGPQPRLHLHEQ